MDHIAIDFNRAAERAKTLREVAGQAMHLRPQVLGYLREGAAALDEVARLRQGLWDVYAALGCDTDGDPTPRALVGDLVKLVVDAAKEANADYHAAIGVPLKEG